MGGINFRSLFPLPIITWCPRCKFLTPAELLSLNCCLSYLLGLVWKMRLKRDEQHCMPLQGAKWHSKMLLCYKGSHQCLACLHYFYPTIPVWIKNKCSAQGAFAMSKATWTVNSSGAAQELVLDRNHHSNFFNVACVAPHPLKGASASIGWMGRKCKGWWIIKLPLLQGA